MVGLSAGPDSTALLFLLSVLRRKYDLKLSAAHLNHGLQKKDGKVYHRLARKIAIQLGIPFYSKTISLRALAKRHKRSLEEMGRLERYLFFKEVANKARADKIVTAHTLDEQAETVLLRMLRGSGLRGLLGIPWKRRDGQKIIIRPLLSTPKESLLIFLKENHIAYAQDKTNRDILFTRNRVRHRLLPLLEKEFNPKIKESLSSLQEVCSDIQGYLEMRSAQAYARCLSKKQSPTQIALSIARLKKLHPAIRREVLLIALLHKKGDLKRFGFTHIESLVEAVDSPQKNLTMHLPGPLSIHKTGEELVF